jgi:DNA-binding protein H-NS
MAKKSLATMSIDALVELRDDIGAMLARRAGELRNQLARFGGSEVSGTDVGNGRRGRRGRKKGSKLRGRKVAPKYRGPGGETWAGRGARPRWLVAALKGGKKLDSFLIAKGAKKRKAKR